MTLWESLYRLYPDLVQSTSPASRAPLGVAFSVISWFCSRYQSCLSCLLGSLYQLYHGLAQGTVLPLVTPWESLYWLYHGLVQSTSPPSRAPLRVALPVISWFGSLHQSGLSCPIGSRFTDYILVWPKAPVRPLMSLLESLYRLYPCFAQGTSRASRVPFGVALPVIC